MKSSILSAAVLTALVFNSDAGGSPHYVITDLGTLGGGMSYAHGMNASGQVVGWAETAAGGTHAFLYGAGTMTDIGTLWANSLNDLGQVAGSFLAPSGYGHAALYGNGTRADLGTLGGNASEAQGANSAGQVVGWANTSAGFQTAFLYSNGTMRSLGTLGGPSSWAMRINARGQAVGSADTAGGDMHAFLYSNGSMTDLGTLGGQWSYGYDINASGQVVGTSSDASGKQHAVLYSNGTMTDLGSLGLYTESDARGINSSGQVVGRLLSRVADTYTSQAFLYSGATLYDLSTLVSADSPWGLAEALAINDSGQIIGNGYIGITVHAFLATPAQLGDADLDGKVDIRDLNKVLTQFGQSGLDWADGDFDGNGIVDVADLNKVLTAYGHSLEAPRGINVVPEPSGLVLLAVGGLGLLYCCPLALGRVVSRLRNQSFICPARPSENPPSM